jgi:hypothetical protein
LATQLIQLAVAGIVVSPAFESVDEENTNNTLYEEFKAYENLWD